VTDGIAISEALIPEIGAIACIHRAARRAAMTWLADIHTPEEDRWFFEAIVFREDTLLVAREHARIVGFVAYKDDWLNHLYVSPEHWRRGIGGRLLNAAQKASKSLQLWTFQRNKPARVFYLVHGFEDCELTDGRGNEEQEPDMRMAWRF